MSEDPIKIKITKEEVDKAVLPPMRSAPADSTNRAPVPIHYILALGGFLIVLFGLFFVGSKNSPVSATTTTEQYIAQTSPKISNELSESAKLKEYVEAIHPLTSFKSARVSEMRVRTVDGSNLVGKLGSNISEVELLVTFYWEGPLTKDGFTEVRFSYDNNGHTKSFRFERSNAAINLATVDWFKVGFTIGALLAP
jgi:hypothetical protein